MAKTRMCVLCGERPAEVPDRNRMGRPIKRVCKACHAGRLRRDLRHISEMARAQNLRNNPDQPGD